MERCSIESIFSMLVPGRYKWYLYLMETGTYIAMRCHVLGYCREIISNILTRFLKTQSTKEKERFTHPRKDSIQYFFYFQAELHNKMVRLNIAQRIRVKDNGKRDFPLFYKWRDKEIGKEASKATVRSLNASVQFLWYFFVICKKITRTLQTTKWFRSFIVCSYSLHLSSYFSQLLAAGFLLPLVGLEFLHFSCRWRRNSRFHK